MSFKDNFLNFLNITKTIFSNNLSTQKNSPSSTNNQQDSNYSQGNEREKNPTKKDESEGENDKNIYDFLTKDIINSINDIFSEPNNNSKNEPKKEATQDKTEPYRDKKDSPKQKKSETNNTKFEEKETKNEFSFNFGKFSDFLNNNLFGNKDENKNDKKNNNWNFNMSPSEIFNMDNKNNQQNNNEKNNLNNNKETTNIKNESFKFNFGNANNNNKGSSEKEKSFNNNSSNQIFNFFPNLNNYINFEYKSNNKQTQNKYTYTENKFMNNDNKITTSFYEHKSSDNKFDIYNFNSNNINLNIESKETKQEHTSNINISNNNNNEFKPHGNNKFTTFYNNNINLSNLFNQNKNFESHDTMTNNNNPISLGKYIDNLDQEKYLITMFGKPGWICRLCNNFNFKSRNICNRCNAIKAPRTKEEIKEKEEFDKMMKKKIKEKKTDWLCLNCQNINYSFRRNCNRCGVERKKEFPPIIYPSNPNIDDKSNNTKNIDVNDDIKNNVNNNN